MRPGPGGAALPALALRASEAGAGGRARGGSGCRSSAAGRHRWHGPARPLSSRLQAHAYTLALLATECTTPFVNLRFFLDKGRHRCVHNPGRWARDAPVLGRAAPQAAAGPGAHLRAPHPLPRRSPRAGFRLTPTARPRSPARWPPAPPQAAGRATRCTPSTACCCSSGGVWRTLFLRCSVGGEARFFRWIRPRRHAAALQVRAHAGNAGVLHVLQLLRRAAGWVGGRAGRSPRSTARCCCAGEGTPVPCMLLPPAPARRRLARLSFDLVGCPQLDGGARAALPPVLLPRGRPPARVPAGACALVSAVLG